MPLKKQEAHSKLMKRNVFSVIAAVNFALMMQWK
jgi:hypothetical protein